MQHSFLSTVSLLVIVIDPIGILPLCVPLLRTIAPERRAWVLLRETLIAFIVLLIFMLFGHTALEKMGLTEASLSISGGVILFLIALRMIFPHPNGVFGLQAGQEPFVVPLAIPLLAGPSAIATVLVVASRGQSIWEQVAALTVAMTVCGAIMIGNARLSRLLGQQVFTAIERTMGLILTAIAIQMLMEGIKKFIHQF